MANPTRRSITFPPDVYEQVHGLAQKHERTFNQELIWLLRQAFIARESLRIMAALRGKDPDGAVDVIEDQYVEDLLAGEGA